MNRLMHLATTRRLLVTLSAAVAVAASAGPASAADLCVGSGAGCLATCRPPWRGA